MSFILLLKKISFYLEPLERASLFIPSFLVTTTTSEVYK